MTIRSRVDVTDRFPLFKDEFERRVRAGLNAAAVEAAIVADAKANYPKPIARFVPIFARNIGDGFASGVKAGPLARIFDKGSLGKRSAPLERDSRKPEWEVSRGTNPYHAHRHDDIGDKGIAPRRILNTARKAGRKRLVQALTRL